MGKFIANDLDGAAKWFKKAVNRIQNGYITRQKYQNALASIYAEMGKEKEALDIWNILIYQNNYKPAIDVVEELFLNKGIVSYENGNYKEAEGYFSILCAEPFYSSAEQYCYLAMSQIKQSNFDQGWQNMRISADKGYKLAIQKLEKLDKHNTTSNDNSKSGFDWDKIVKTVGKYALKGAAVIFLGQVID